ncbi:MAG: thiazole synthase [Pseudomonadota bacterium]
MDGLLQPETDAAPDTASADPLTLYGRAMASRLLLGTARYPSPHILSDAIAASGAAIVTVSLRREAIGLRREAEGDGAGFWDIVKNSGAALLPNTAGCRTAREAVTTAQMARELFGTSWVKLEVIGGEDTLHPDVFGLVDAARTLTSEGFEVFPYTTDDLSVAERLLAAGCEVLMPWGAPIGTGRGLADPYALRMMRAAFPEIPLIVDAGLGRPSHAAEAMELGLDAALLNTAVALAGDPVEMARAFAGAVEAGRRAWRADPMEPRDMAAPSTPIDGLAQFNEPGAVGPSAPR